jgi:NTP pyrophosphatase (non-canonical NTP hydrolase)
MDEYSIDPAVRARWARARAGREPQFEAATQRFADALALMADLRGPEGCPWDREQSLASLRQYVREEADEVCQAIDRILEFEAGLRAAAGLPAADPLPPAGDDKARTPKKGHTIAHHPHRSDFDAATSAAGAPLPALSEAQRAQRDALYTQLIEELGDLLLQSLFQGDILHAQSYPGVEGSLKALVEKLVRRHPHVYGEGVAANSAEVLANWEQIKRAEKGGE